MYTHFSPKRGSRYGTLPVFVSGAVNATSSATVNTPIVIPRTKAFVSKCQVMLSTVGVSASGTILLKLQVLAADGTTARDMTGTISLESDGVSANIPVALSITASDTNRVVAEGESLRLNVVSNNTNGTAPAGECAVELLVME